MGTALRLSIWELETCLHRLHALKQSYHNKITLGTTTTPDAPPPPNPIMIEPIATGNLITSSMPPLKDIPNTSDIDDSPCRSCHSNISHKNEICPKIQELTKEQGIDKQRGTKRKMEETMGDNRTDFEEGEINEEINKLTDNISSIASETRDNLKKILGPILATD
jgi:hypothetical protein